jgi:hypothetical protein
MLLQSNPVFGVGNQTKAEGDEIRWGDNQALLGTDVRGRG